MSTTLPPPIIYSPSNQSHNSLLPSIARLHAACITQDNTMATFLPPLSHGKILASWTSWSEQVKAGSRVIVLQLSQDEQEVAGVVSLDMPYSETGRHRSEVGRLLVSPDFRKRGVARRLMGLIEQVAKEKDRWMVTLDTTIGSGAEHVYPRLGYKEIGIVPNFGVSPKDGSLQDEIYFYKDLRKDTTERRSEN